MKWWEEEDNIERENTYEKFQPNERRKIAPSDQEILHKFDKLACEGNPTEEDFHQDNQKATFGQKDSYLQKALRTTLRWQSFCQTNT